MAVVNTTTTAIASADATGTKFARAGEPEVVKVGTVEVASGDSIGSTLRLIRVPSNMRITSLELSSDAITSAAADIGVYDISANGSAVVDADQFGSAVSLPPPQDQTTALHLARDRAGQDQRAPRSCARRHLEDGPAAVAAPGSVRRSRQVLRPRRHADRSRNGRGHRDPGRQGLHGLMHRPAGISSLASSLSLG